VWLKPRDITVSVVFAVLTAIGAWISIPLPITPVPFTMQVLFVLLSGAVLGGRLGALAQIIYLLLGLVGLPVFAGGASGPSVLVGPTGGYLFGYVFAAYLTGRITESKRSPRLVWMIFATLSGLFLIYAFGEIGLWMWLKISFPALLMFGVIPFLPLDVIKAIMAAYIASRRQVKQLIQKQN
jgi:biotin transport system substrate-specific component